MTRLQTALRLALAAAALAFAAEVPVAHADPVIGTHPRLLLTAAEKTRLLAKVNANEASWQALKARADTLATYSINQYKFPGSDAPAGTIYYTYQGEGWYDAALPLAFAYQMTGDTTYSNKLVQLAQEMIRAQGDLDNNPPNGLPPIRLDSYYASRNVAAVVAFIYDYCYDQLGAPLRAQMVALMNDYYDDVSANGYQAVPPYDYAADGNYFGGHLYGVALMGYASFGDNPRAQEMIDWARNRFDGALGAALPAPKRSAAWRTQAFDGGQRPAVSLDFNGPDITGNPFKGGFDFQAWSYGSEEFSRMIDYMLIVKSATGEDTVAPRIDWFSQILRAEKHALFPNRFLIDPTGDWGGFQGAVISRGLPTRLAFVLAGTADGPGAQHFAYSEIAESTIAGVQVFSAPEWVEFFFNVPSRPSAELVLPPYYTGFAPSYPQGAPSPGGTNGAIPYFIMRSDWSAGATWASIQMGSQWWDDHQHYHAGHLIMARGGDYLLVSAGDWKTEVDGGGNPIYGRSGVLGTSLEALQSSLANTLYFDDFGDFQGTDDRGSGGQSAVGIDQVVAAELSQDLSYVRSDLSTAYNRNGDPADTVNRKLDFFYRSFLYLRASNVFVVYDQVQAKPSANPRGPYRKHIRWHLPNAPAITGQLARLDHGQSRLFIDTVLPAGAGLAVVDEWTNPDPCDGSTPCVPFGANAATFRIEVSHPQNPLFIPFLTVLQPGPSASTPPTSTRISSLDGKMIGVDVSQAGGARSIVLFNDQPGQVPAPVTSTSYDFSGSAASHTLMGVVPGGRYSAALTDGVVHVDQSPTGNTTASLAGVLHFTLQTNRPRFVVTGAGPGGGPEVKVFSGAGTPTADVFAYDPAFTGGVFVAVGDLDGSGTAHVVTGTAFGGGAHVRAFNLDGSPRATSFLVYPPGFIGGVRVAACDFDGDGRAEILTGAGPGGGPHVRVIKLGPDGNPTGDLADFMAYDPGFTGGLFVACGDLDGDGVPEIILGVDAGGGPHVRIFRYAPASPGGVAPFHEFFAYDPGFRGGIRVTAGDVDASGRASLVTGAGPGGGPHVRVLKWTGSDLVETTGFLVYAAGFANGIHVAAGHVTGGAAAEIVTGADTGGGPHVRVFTGTGADTGTSFFAYDPAFTGGVRVGAAP